MSFSFLYFTVQGTLDASCKRDNGQERFLSLASWLSLCPSFGEVRRDPGLGMRGICTAAAAFPWHLLGDVSLGSEQWDVTPVSKLYQNYPDYGSDG